VSYNKGCNLTDSPEDFNTLSENIKGAEVIIFVGGVSPALENEGHDRADAEIPEVQRKLVQNLKTLGLYLHLILL
jgi:beta-glucosidase